MVAERHVIDVETVSDLEDLLDELHELRGPTVLRRRGQEIATVNPIVSRARPRRKRVVPEAELEAVKAAAGGWKDHLDVDAFLDEIYAIRDLGIRPLVKV